MGTKRIDGRKPNQLRPMSAEIGLLNRADGSARFSQDKTSVLVAVYGPHEAKAKYEKPDAAVVDVTVRPRCTTIGPGIRYEREMEQLLSRTLSHTIMTTFHPRTAISIVVQILNDDGAVLATAVNACTLALLDAGVPMGSLGVAVSCCVDTSGTLLLDPVATEENTGASGVFVYESGGQTSSGAEAGLIATRTRGLFSQEGLAASSNAGRRACHKVALFIRASLQRAVAV